MIINNIYTHKINKEKLVIILAFLFFLIFTSSKLEASSSTIKGFILSTCNETNCIKLSSPTAKTSYLDSSLIVLENARLEIYSLKEKRKLITYISPFGSIDSQINRITLKNLDDNNSKDLSFNLKTGDYKVFKKTFSMNN